MICLYQRTEKIQISCTDFGMGMSIWGVLCAVHQNINVDDTLLGYPGMIECLQGRMGTVFKYIMPISIYLEFLLLFQYTPPCNLIQQI